MVLINGPVDLGAFIDDLCWRQDAGKIQAFCLPVINGVISVQQVNTSNHVIHLFDSKPRHDQPHFLGHHEHVVHDMFRFA